ncbi:MAG: hypothetical protein DRR16_21170 [Candidatus Parabeggiatoa sp. nov. 3]|jgi:predicted translin family RNA/ssDNA-binding protein|nr:MAG: hypothetical protein DRR00_25540 [Gammaproteobacteria bacterium]RKZ60204.1 MAG: hypothetical protein DRQ99_22445 [Gammaproteobacteria bacterium]RKZ81857.1 MAG: hypothetical protein DRR16_21170 [Gammaproteobacteria bacterium]
MLDIYLLTSHKLELELIQSLLHKNCDLNSKLENNEVSAARYIGEDLTDSLIVERLTANDALDEWEETYPIYKQLFENKSYPDPNVLYILYSRYHEGVNDILGKLLDGLNELGINAEINNGKGANFKICDYKWHEVDL